MMELFAGGGALAVGVAWFLARSGRRSGRTADVHYNGLLRLWAGIFAVAHKDPGRREDARKVVRDTLGPPPRRQTRRRPAPPRRPPARRRHRDPKARRDARRREHH